MSVLIDYVSAASDVWAAGLLDCEGGVWPEGVGWRDGGLDFAQAPLIDPHDQLALLGELAGGGERDGFGSAAVVAMRGEGARVVVAVPGGLTSALARSAGSGEDLARRWRGHPDYAGDFDDENDARTVVELTGLAVRALERGHRLYCWIQV